MRKATPPIAAVVACVLVVACGSAASAPPGPDPTATGQPSVETPATVTPENIIALSERAMLEVPFIETETMSWYRDTGESDQLGQLAYQYFEGKTRLAFGPEYLPKCAESEPRSLPFADRIPDPPSPPAQAATAPSTIELLREDTYQGRPVWVLRYRYEVPSIEGPFPVEVTEWVDRESHLLLRAEAEEFDPFGFRGQQVAVFLYPETLPECPREARVPADQLRPLTTPRLQYP